MKKIPTHLRKTKIIATFGPAIQEQEIFRKTIQAGVNVLRFNFSHLTPEQTKDQINWVRKQLSAIKYDVAFLADLKGPEIRTDLNTYTLKQGEEFYCCHVTYKNILAKKVNKKIVGIDYVRLYSLVQEGQKILADDGDFEFRVLGVEGKGIRLKCMNTGTLKSKKSIIIPGVDIGLPILNKIDRANLRVAIKENFSWVAASFVSNAKDVQTIRAYLKKCGREIPIISKIENRKGIDHIDEIIQVSNGIMVARGDLGLEFYYEEVPILQEMIVNKTKEHGKIIIIATQMLNSMIENSRPSRPEVSDIATAIKSHVDAVMLSGETASGKHPFQAVTAMNRVIVTSEYHHQDEQLFKYQDTQRLAPFCEMAIQLAFALKTKAIIAISSKGNSARYLSSFRANMINLIATKNIELYYRSFLYYAVYPVMMKSGTKSDAKSDINKQKLFKEVIKQCKKKNLLKRGDRFIHIFTHKPKYISDKQFLLATNSIREEMVE